MVDGELQSWIEQWVHGVEVYQSGLDQHAVLCVYNSDIVRVNVINVSKVYTTSVKCAIVCFAVRDIADGSEWNHYRGCPGVWRSARNRGSRCCSVWYVVIFIGGIYEDQIPGILMDRNDIVPLSQRYV